MHGEHSVCLKIRRKYQFWPVILFSSVLSMCKVNGKLCYTQKEWTKSDENSQQMQKLEVCIDRWKKIQHIVSIYSCKYPAYRILFLALYKEMQSFFLLSPYFSFMISLYHEIYKCTIAVLYTLILAKSFTTLGFKHLMWCIH